MPVVQPETLVNLESPGPKQGSTSCNDAGDCDAVFSYPMFRDLEAGRTGFAGIAAHRTFGANLAFQGQTLNGDGALVSGSYFPLLGVQPALGRLIGREDDVSALIELFTRSDTRMVTITGVGGVGKTRVALEAGGRLQRCDPLEGPQFVANPDKHCVAGRLRLETFRPLHRPLQRIVGRVAFGDAGQQPVHFPVNDARVGAAGQ